MSAPDSAPQGAPEHGQAQRVATGINRIAGGIARHWLGIFNVIVALFVGLPFLAPVLMQAGARGPATVIYQMYAPACHQLPERSVFLFGPQQFYSVRMLEAEGELPPGLGVFERQALRWVGSVETGWKVALCQRDLAIYGSILLAGLLFGVVRRTGAGAFPRDGVWRKRRLVIYAIMVLPIAVDGFSQLFGLRESFPALRFLTGALFGAATVWCFYPYVEEAMEDASRQAPQVSRSNIGS